jgi:hypothetical protein
VAKTADVRQAIWADPWFLALPPDGKLIYFWAITNEHSNMAGLYVVAEETIRHETKFTAPRLEKAFKMAHPQLGYRPESGTVVVPGRPKYARTKTEQIAKSIASAVRECAHQDIQRYYLEKYAANAWLGPYMADLAQELEISELHQTSPNLVEVHSQSQSLKEEQKPQKVGKAPKPNPDALPRDFDLRLGAAAKRCLPILQRTAEARAAKPVTLLAVARAVESFPRKDHFAVAGNVEHWLVHGNGARQKPKDVVARFRNFLEGSEDTATPQAAATGRRTDPALAKIVGREA